MKQGDRVTIYQDPLTQESPEGEATLVYIEDANAGIYDGYLVQRWAVQFKGERDWVSRQILTTFNPEDEIG